MVSNISSIPHEPNGQKYSPAGETARRVRRGQEKGRMVSSNAKKRLIADYKIEFQKKSA
jgi:hypothetical protein